MTPRKRSVFVMLPSDTLKQQTDRLHFSAEQESELQSSAGVSSDLCANRMPEEYMPTRSIRGTVRIVLKLTLLRVVTRL